MNNGWTERIAELTESRDHWKREWRLLNAGLNMAEDKIKELEAENKRLGEALDRIESMATIENTEIQKIAREALKEASHES